MAEIQCMFKSGVKQHNPNPYPNITFILYFSIGWTITGYPSHCTVISDGPCKQKAVMNNNHTEPCDGPISSVGR